MRYFSRLLFGVFVVSVQVACAHKSADSKPLPETNSPTSQTATVDLEMISPFSDELLNDLAQYFESQGDTDDGFLPAFKAAFHRYSSAIERLGDKLVECQGRVVENSDWLERWRTKSSSQARERTDQDLRLALGRRWVELKRDCEKLTVQEALYAEFEFLPLNARMREELMDFLKSLSGKKRREISIYLQETAPSNHHLPGTPLQAVLTSDLYLTSIEKAKNVDPATWEFVVEEPTFREPFQIQSVLEKLDN